MFHKFLIIKSDNGTGRLIDVLLAVLLSVVVASCRDDVEVVPMQSVVVKGAAQPESDLKGFYVLNEGNMGSNKCTLDYMDIATGTYFRNIFPQANPSAVMELGDVGNHAIVYGNKLYLAVNCSHKVEVLDARTARRVATIDVASPRFLLAHEGSVYVTSYVGREVGMADAPLGEVCRIDTAQLHINARTTVGYQPEQMAVAGGFMYVANSGGYRAPVYDNRLSVINLGAMEVVRNITVGPNLELLVADGAGSLWLTERGDIDGHQRRLHVLDVDPSTGNAKVAKTFEVAITAMACHDDVLYTIGTDPEGKVVSTKFSTISRTSMPEGVVESSQTSKLVHPYSLAINPENGNILIGDARNYISSGRLYCFTPDGKLLWETSTGDIPSSIVFVGPK